MSLKSFGKEVINAYSQGKPVLRAYSNGKLAYRQQQEIIYSAKVKSGTPYFDIDGTTLNLPINGVVNSIQGHSLYVVPQGDTQHSAIPAPTGGACWCRVTNRYYNVLQNNGVGELEYEPISVNKNPRTEYSCEALTADMFETPLTVPADATVKFVTSLKTLDGYTTLLRLNDSSTIDIGVNLYVENGTTVKLQHNGATYEAPYALAIDTDYTFAITPTSLKINGVDVLTYPARTYPVDTLTWYCNLTNVLKSSILVYNTSPIAELIPVPEGDVQYSDIPAPVGGALWDRVTNKYYAKQGTGILKFKPLPRLALVSTGTQYIDTGIPHTESTYLINYRFKTNTLARQLNGWPGLYFGISDNNRFEYRTAKSQMQVNNHYNNSLISIDSRIPSSTIAIMYNNGVNILNNTSGVPLNTANMSLLRHNPNISFLSMIGNLTNAYIYVGNTLAQNLIPVKQGDTFHKTDSTPAPSNCMYDTVTDTYFQNAGTGTFGITYE